MQSNMLTPKEINMIMRDIKTEEFEYKSFDRVLYEVRFELTKSRLMDANIDKI